MSRSMDPAATLPSHQATMPTPRGIAAGTGYLVFAWVAALGIARLTGAVPVVILLGGGLVTGLFGVVDGWWRLRRISSVTATIAAVSVDVGHRAPIIIRAGHERRPRPVHVSVRDRGAPVADGWLVDGELQSIATLDRRGMVEALDVELSSGGAAGILWWRRRFRLPIAPIVVAPRSTGPGAHVDIDERSNGLTGDALATGRATDGDLDGVRRWRDGDADHAVHWPTSLRTGVLSVFDHRRSNDSRWIVRALEVGADAHREARDAEAGRVRWALDEGRRRGAVVSAAVGQCEPIDLPDTASIARWTATCLPDTPPSPVRGWRRIRITRTTSAEPVDVLGTRARWLVAVSSALALTMLAGALGSSPVTFAALIGGSLLTAAMTTGGTGRRSLKVLVQILVASFTVAGLIAITVSVSNAEDLLSVIRGPLPQVLMLLVVLHGFECTSRRAARASAAFAAVVAAYAAGQRIDPLLPWWLAAWGITWLFAVRAIGAAHAPAGEPSRRRRSPVRPSPRRLAGSVGTVAIGAVAAIALLSVVPIPDGPARLGLPSSIERILPVATSTGIAGADGADTASSSTRDTSSRTGSVGGFPGFDHTLDTSMRGTLGNEVVMRVRAPEPDFWRGQTFATFDGRGWKVIEDPGFLQDGPDIRLEPSFGDVDRSTLVDSTEFIQTFYVEVDQPNILFGAYRPERVLFDGNLFVRADGALRTDLVLTEGSIYTVVSERPLVTAEALARQGSVPQRLTTAGRDAFALYLETPPSTTERTVQLADELAQGATSTYDVVRRMEAWIRDNVQYDLQAPVPADGVDAVDDLLFGSNLGFCEQIATSLAIMLRTQGVPTRLATGYVPGDRDRVTGVWEVRARDAHAWVEVWFPETGWQAFDPTAAVPLAGESVRASVGGDILTSVIGAIDQHGRTVAVVALFSLLLVIGVGVAARVLAAHRYQRRRGRWGVLQDRWHAAAHARGIDDACSNPELARRWSTTMPPHADVATQLADQLDRAAFDPQWIDDDESFERALSLVDALERPRSRAG